MAPEWFIDFIGDERAADIIARYLLSFIIILFTFYVLRGAATYILRRILRLTHRTASNWDEAVVDAINPPLRLILVLVGIWLALAVLDFNDDIAQIISDVAAILIAIAFFWGVYRLIDAIGDAIANVANQDERIDRNIVRFGRQLAKGLIWIIAFVIVMDQLGYNLNGLLAGLGIGGLAVALAAQETLGNLVGYFAIMADSPFGVGDFIVTDAGSGTVEHIGFRSTRIRQLDQAIVFVPNGKLAASSITNWTRLSKRRLDMNLGLTYDTNPEQILSVVQAIRNLLDGHPRVIADSVFVQFFAFNDSSLDVRIICYINEPDWGEFHAIKEDIYIRMMSILEERGVEIAFPTQTMVMRDAAKSPLLGGGGSTAFPEPVYAPPRQQNSDLGQEQPGDPVSTDEIADADGGGKGGQ